MTDTAPVPAVVLIVFNRPRQTAETFAAIRAQRPPVLFIAADGPRPGHPTDAERCRAVREVVAAVDWPCDVRHDYSEVNLGCKRRNSSALDWVFSEVDRAIILEDDCVAHPDFFGFCRELLQRYADDERVSVIGSQNYQGGVRRGSGSYYFSRYNHVWGWATWRRAWRRYTPDIPFWPEWRRSTAWRAWLPDPIERRMWEGIFDGVHSGTIGNSWGYPWMASVWHGGGLTATPNVNLVSNIGFGPDATHTLADHDQAGAPSFALGPIVHPDEVRQDAVADRVAFDRHYGGLAIRARRTIPGLARAIGRRVARLSRHVFARA